MARIHFGGHPDQGYTHGVRHHWSDEQGAHETTFWFTTAEEACANYDRIAAECREAPKHDRIELIVDGEAVTP